MCEQNTWIEFQRISVDDFESLILKARAQEICKSHIFFDRQNMRSFFQEKPGQRAQAGANLDDVISRSDLRLIDDPASEVLIVQKILPKTFGWRHADFFQCRAYFRQLHRAGARLMGPQEKALSLFTKFCEQ